MLFHGAEAKVPGVFVGVVMTEALVSVVPVLLRTELRPWLAAETKTEARRGRENVG